MQIKSKILIAGIILSLCLSGCQFPVQVVSVVTRSPYMANGYPSNEALLATISALQTRVAAIPTKTQTPESTATPASTNTPLPTPTSSVITATIPAGVPCNRATFVADVTIPDGTYVTGGSTFTKTWRIRNSGFCTWTTGYSLAFDHGNSLGQTLTAPLTSMVSPGDTVDLSVTLVAPSSNGYYAGYWKIRDANGVLFGIGADASVAFWVKVRVGNYYWDGYYDYYPDYPHNHDYYGGCQVLAVSPSSGTTFSPGGTTDIKWTVRNTSDSTWSSGDVDYTYIGGTQMFKHDTYDLPVDVAPGGVVDLVVDVYVPNNTGNYSATWALVRGSSRLCTMAASIWVR